VVYCLHPAMDSNSQRQSFNQHDLETLATRVPLLPNQTGYQYLPPLQPNSSMLNSVSSTDAVFGHGQLSTTRPSGAQFSLDLPPRKKQRRLDYLKCVNCRLDKQKVGHLRRPFLLNLLIWLFKCKPGERQWPGEKCERCETKNLPCSEPSRKAKPILSALGDLPESAGGPIANRDRPDIRNHFRRTRDCVDLDASKQLRKAPCRHLQTLTSAHYNLD
jgi:hypothetical protein